MKDTPKTLHKEHCELIEDKPNLYLNHQYHRTYKTWKFIGYRCSACGQSLKQIGNINKHNELCRILNNKKYIKKTKGESTDL